MAEDMGFSVIMVGQRWHLFKYDIFVAHFDTKLKAVNAMRKRQGLPPRGGQDKRSDKHGVHYNKASNFWKVYFRGTFVRSYQYEFTAREKLRELLKEEHEAARKQIQEGEDGTILKALQEGTFP